MSDDLFDQMDRWLTAILSDHSHRPRAQKIVRNKPADLVDACWDPSGNKIVEPQTAFGPGQYNQLYPTSLAPQLVAGAPIVNDVIKCHLKRIDPRDYRVTFAQEQWERLQKVFPEGVCDWSRPGVGQRDLETWSSFGPSQDNLNLRYHDATEPSLTVLTYGTGTSRPPRSGRALVECGGGVSSP